MQKVMSKREASRCSGVDRQQGMEDRDSKQCSRMSEKAMTREDWNGMITTGDREVKKAHPYMNHLTAYRQ